jgi:hypothetical protein
MKHLFETYNMENEQFWRLKTTLNSSGDQN